jgi:hypothetical protein
MHDKEVRAEQLIDEIDQAGLRLTAERDAAREVAARYRLMLDQAEARERALENVLAVVLRSLKDIVTSVPNLGKG